MRLGREGKMLGGRTVNTRRHKAATPQPVSRTLTAVLQQGSEGPQVRSKAEVKKRGGKP